MPVGDYFKGQGRYRHLDDKLIAYIQGKVNEKWDRLLKLSEATGDGGKSAAEGNHRVGDANKLLNHIARYTEEGILQVSVQSSKIGGIFLTTREIPPNLVCRHIGVTSPLPIPPCP